MIKIEQLSKTFNSNKEEVYAVVDVTLEIAEGEIFGVIGYSGAGKSTLVRCINFLESPNSGRVTIDGFGSVEALNGELWFSDGGPQEKLTDRKLRELRRGIGMIFQHFNLMDRSTVFDNIAYPLKHTGRSKEDIRAKVDELLELVDLSEKRNVYPSQLSGGQKQRVAIARALANEPKILLCDEATSALDPEATDSILKLLKELNERLGLTIVIITHEMAVIRSIADKVAVMENGKVVECGEVYDIFASPQQDVTRRFVDTSSGLGNIDKLLKGNAVAGSGEGQQLLKLTFTKECVGEALISQVSRECGVDLNIMLANIDIVQGSALGGIIASIKGSPDNVEAAMKRLRDQGVRLEVM